MAQQNINQYVYPNWGLNFALETYDMSLTSDERNYNQEVVFSPYLIAQTYGNRLPFYFDINNPLSVQDLTLNYKDYNRNNIFVSQNFYNPKELDITCFNSHTSCDIGLTGIDNGLVTKMTGETITFTEGLFSDDLKFNRMYFDRRLKLFQVTGNTQSPNVRFSGFNKTVLYEVVSKYSPYEGRYHELYGGFYQGFYKLFGYDYEIFPERMNRGWSVEMLLKPRLVNEYIPTSGETTLNQIYPQNKNIFFYLGARAENKFYHYANGTPNCFTGYTRVTSDLYNCIQTCACCNRTVTDSRCIYVYPPRSLYGIHDPHVNYGCHECRGIPEQKITCGCDCNLDPCETCGWECQTHTCASIIEPTPTPTPTPTSTPTNCEPTTPTCTDVCYSCSTCYDFGNCETCKPTGFSSIEYTCETNPLFDAMSNALSFKLCGDPKNPQIGVKVLRFTGGCETSGTCSTSGLTYTTGYTVTEYCSPGGIYPTCYSENPAWLNEEHWFQLDAVWERYTWLDDCDLWYRGGLGIITQEQYLESLAHNSVSLITVPYTISNSVDPSKIELVNLNGRWLDEEKYRRGRLKIYINGKIFYTIEDFQEIIPRALSTDKEKQVGVPFNVSWGGGTQGLRENLTFSSCTLPYGPYQQDPECFPVNDLTGTTFNGMNTNIVIEQNFAGTFEGGISQFRMYTSPLSAPEVKHNFNILKNTFRMFNPDCPDCSTEICPPDDFTYTIGDISTTTTTTIPVTTTTTTIPVTTTTTTIPVTRTPTPTLTVTPTPTPTLEPLNLTLFVEYTPGSIIASYTLELNRLYSEEINVTFENVLNFYSGSPITIFTGVTVSLGSLSGQTIVTIDEDYNNYTGVPFFSQLSGTPVGSTWEIIVIPFTPTPTPTPTLTPTPIPHPLNDFTYLIIPNNDLYYITIPNNDLSDSLIPNNDLSDSLIPNNDLSNGVIPNNDFNDNHIPNDGLGSEIIPNNDFIPEILELTGGCYNLITLPYFYPTDGNIIFPEFSGPGGQGILNPNTFDINGVDFNFIDDEGNNLYDYFIQLLDNDYLIYFSQNGNTAIYQGDRYSFSNEFGGLINGGSNPNNTQLILIQPSPVDFIENELVCIWYEIITPICEKIFNSNETNIVIPDSGIASSYPITFTVSGITNDINVISLTLSGYSHTFAGDVGMVLISPNNSYNSIITGREGSELSASNVDVLLNSNQTLLWDGVSPGIYMNNSLAFADLLFNSPCPVQFNMDDTTQNLTVFVGLQPMDVNGTWTLYIQDFESEDEGTLSGATLIINQCTTFYGLVRIGEGPDVCDGGPGYTTFNVTGDGPTFCESINFISDGFIGLNGYIFMYYDGYFKTVNVDGSYTATFRDSCTSCPTPTPTLTPTPTPTPTPIPPSIVSDGLVLYYDFSDPISYSGSGSTIIDLSPSNNDGVVINNYGHISYVSSGSTSHFNWDSNAGGAGSNSFSGSIWTTSANTYLDFTMIISPDFSMGGIGGMFCLPNDKSLRVYSNQWQFPNPGNGDDWASSPTTYYVNGQVSNQMVSGWNIIGGAKNNNSPAFPDNGILYVGTSGYENRNMQGNIAVVLMYNRVLTQQEQVQNYNFFKTRFGL